MRRITIIIKDLISIKEIYAYLSRKDKFLIYSLLGCLVISSIAELIGIASIIPLVEILKDPINIDNYYIKAYLNLIFDITGIQRVNTAIFSSIFVVIFAYASRLFSQFFILYTSAEIGISLHDKALRNYLMLPYDKQLGGITNDLPFCLTRGINRVLGRIIFQWLNAISSFLLFIFLSGGLFFAEPRITFLFLILTSFYYVIVYVPFIKSLSKRSKLFHSYSKEHLESLKGLKWFIKQLKLYGIEKKYFANLSNLHSRIRKLDTTSKFISTYPRTLLEFFLILIIISIVSFNSQTELNNFTTKLLFSILVIQKLLPVFSSLYVSFKDILENKYDLKDLLVYLKIPYSKSNLNIDVSSKEISTIEIKNISFKYPNQPEFILSEISLSVDIDKYYILKAPSGYGKSTLIDLMLGLQIPNKGKISYKGFGINKNATEIISGKFIAYVPQVNYFNDGKLKDILSSHYHDKNISDAAIFKACKTAELGSLIDSKGEYLSINCSNNLLNFSSGQRQRLAIAQALIHPKLKMLILDETFSNIDRYTCKKILNNIKNNFPRIGILIITHDKSFIPDYYQKILLEKFNKKMF